MGAASRRRCSSSSSSRAPLLRPTLPVLAGRQAMSWKVRPLGHLRPWDCIIIDDSKRSAAEAGWSGVGEGCKGAPPRPDAALTTAVGSGQEG